MDRLIAANPCGDHLPISSGTVTLVEVDLGQMTLVMPFKGKLAETSERIKKACGVELPMANTIRSNGDVRVMWFGREGYLVTGVDVGALDGSAAVTDQSDGWACVELTGADVELVLARLVPVDLRPSTFGDNQTARTLVGHMTASLTRLGPERILVMVFRSMATTLLEDLKEAMEAVAARG